MGEMLSFSQKQSKWYDVKKSSCCKKLASLKHKMNIPGLGRLNPMLLLTRSMAHVSLAICNGSKTTLANGSQYLKQGVGRCLRKALSQEIVRSRRGGVRQMGGIWRHEEWQLCARGVDPRDFLPHRNVSGLEGCNRRVACVESHELESTTNSENTLECYHIQGKGSVCFIYMGETNDVRLIA